ncbi:3455_t:CDS:2, partial [Paraglomus brasilianum]
PIYLHRGLTFLKQQNPILEEAVERTLNLVWSEQWKPRVIVQSESPNYPPFPINLTKRTDNANVDNIRLLTAIRIDVKDFSVQLQHGVDESYTLDIFSDRIGTITSKTVWGALHALQTLNQIVVSDGNGGLMIEKTVHIEDAPLYPHRGLLLDTARNFYPVSDLLKTIDALAWSKMNVFHWHLVDSQSWPLQLRSYPQMTGDAYSNNEIYSQSDVRRVIDYGRLRGVRILPEFDMPGHARAGYQQINPEIVACGDSWWSNDDWPYHTAVEPPPGQLDIINQETYKVVNNIISEVTSMFPEKLFHAGFDELSQNCYNYSKYVSEWFKENPNATYPDLAQYFLDRVYPIIKATNKRIVMWEDVLLSPDFPAKDVPKDVILQSWNEGVNNTKKIAAAGYDVIVSSADFLYLDCGFGGWVSNDPRYNQNLKNGATIGEFNWGGTGGSWCAPYKTWQRIYDYDIDYTLTDNEKKHVLGAEAALWSEQSDGVVLDSKVWPRTAALAELLWSGNKDASGRKRYREMAQRINEYRERLVARGVGAAPLQSKWCYKNPHACDLFRNETVPDYN